MLATKEENNMIIIPPLKVEEIIALAQRSRRWFRAFCATVDLLGVKKMILTKPSEAYHRINDLQQAFGDSLSFFPGGSDYRVCFLGDSVWVVRELSPDENQDELWPRFCGHLFAISSILQDLEKDLGNPGLRVIISYGILFQISQPESWRQNPFVAPLTENWFVLTGASEALIKCEMAEHSGSKGGFVGGYCWHEIPGQPCKYHGTRIPPILRDKYWQPEFYPEFYQHMVTENNRSAEIPFFSWEPT